jgi:Armadillo/beta-catenin-like repeat
MSEGRQAAAAECVRALSRSARGLRARLAEAPVAGPLVALLRGATHPEVQAAAAAALCNLVLEFSPVKVPGNQPILLDLLPSARSVILLAPSPRGNGTSCS